MMTRLLLSLLLTLPLAAQFWQTGAWQTVGVGPLANRPATCAKNRHVFICNGAGCSVQGGYHYCTDTNIWSEIPQASQVTVSVKSFGAVGDGITDDTDAIQDAIDSGNSVILFPAGVYSVTGLVVYDKEGITLQGAGSGQGGSALSTQIVYDGDPDGVLLDWKSNRWSVVRDMYLDCNSLAGYGIKNWADMLVASSQKNIFTNLGIRGCTGTPGHALHVGWTTDPDVSQSEYNSITLWDSVVGLFQEGTQTLLNVYRNFSVLCNTTGMDFTEGDARVEHGTFVQPSSAVDDIVVRGGTLWAYFTGNYHEITANRPSNTTAYSFPTSGARAYPTSLKDVRVLWLRASGNVINFDQGGYLKLDTVTFDAAGTGAGVVNIDSAGSYKTQVVSVNTIYTDGITRTITGDSSLLRDYDVIADNDVLGDGTKGGLYGTNLTVSVQKGFFGTTTEVDTSASIHTGGSIVIPNFKALRAKDTDGTPISMVYLGPDNVGNVGVLNAAASNGLLDLWTNGVARARIAAGQRLTLRPSLADDGVSSFQGVRYFSEGVAFANLGTPPNAGVWVWCTNCTVASPCSGSGGGAFAFYNGSAWNCPF